MRPELSRSGRFSLACRIHGVFVDFDLGVGGDPLAGRRSHQGIDLGQRGVALGERLIELYQHVGGARSGGVESCPARHLGRLVGVQPAKNVDRLDYHVLLRLVRQSRRRCRRGRKESPPASPDVGHRGVDLLGDVELLLDQHLARPSRRRASAPAGNRRPAANCVFVSQAMTAFSLPRRPQSTWALAITLPKLAVNPRAFVNRGHDLSGGVGIPALSNSFLPSKFVELHGSTQGCVLS